MPKISGLTQNSKSLPGVFQVSGNPVGVQDSQQIWCSANWCARPVVPAAMLNIQWHDCQKWYAHYV